MSIQPFANTGDNYTTLTNYMLDIIMPELPANAWKMLCFIHRKTFGWNKTNDALSYTQIAAGTGIRSSATISSALKLLEAKQYIIKITGNQWDTVSYCINSALEIEANDTASKIKVTSEIKANTASEIKANDTASKIKVTSEIKANTASEIKAVSLQKLKTQKEIKKKKERDVRTGANAPCPPKEEQYSEPQSKPVKAPKESTPIAVIDALADVCQMDRAMLPKKTHVILAQAAGRIYRAGRQQHQTEAQIIETIRYVADYFVRQDWRGKKGETPTPHVLLELWKQAIDARRTPEPPRPETRYWQPPDPNKYLSPAELAVALRAASEKRGLRTIGEA